MIFLMVGTLASAQVHMSGNGDKGKKEKPQREDVEWIWQYTPDDTNKDGRENELAQDLRFKPLLDQFLTAPQTFWGIKGTKYQPLSAVALSFLSVPDKVVADDKRYVSISGCVVHFCPSRGLLFVDLNGAHHLVIFSAIQWIGGAKTTSQPDAEYTLWVFPSQALSVPSGAGPPTAPGLLPAAFKRSIARWAAEPLAGSHIVQNITHAVLVDPDGTPHQIAPSDLGVPALSTTTPNTEEAPPLKPRN
jgi:hypothetical protein